MPVVTLRAPCSRGFHVSRGSFLCMLCIIDFLHHIVEILFISLHFQGMFDIRGMVGVRLPHYIVL